MYRHSPLIWKSDGYQVDIGECCKWIDITAMPALKWSTIINDCKILKHRELKMPAAANEAAVCGCIVWWKYLKSINGTHAHTHTTSTAVKLASMYFGSK